MRFDELPHNWPSLPLDDGPLAAGVIDLVLGGGERLNKSLLVLPCNDSDAAIGVPCVISDVDWSAPSPCRSQALSFLRDLPAPGFVVALSARRRLPTHLVSAWLRTTEDVLDDSGQSLLAFGVADLDRVEIVGGRAWRNGSLGAQAG
ncbi:hypothetical protein [Dietzia sp. NCCP-2495]|uniref:hypothetical protein n=1 Tax=Dietzia sp. NCCP-2495 TaxID=2934675 RepID=UPI002230DC4C|nr:hypothetical protein [Dietzia sp. NCCP-2495]